MFQTNISDKFYKHLISTISSKSNASKKDPLRSKFDHDLINIMFSPDALLINIYLNIIQLRSLHIKISSILVFVTKTVASISNKFYIEVDIEVKLL